MFRFLSLVMLICTLASVGHTDAADLPILRNEQLGFGRQFHNRHWTPLRVDIENPGPARQVVLTVEPFSGESGQSINLSKPVWLPAKSRRVIWLTVFPDVSENAPAAKLNEPNSGIKKVFVIKLTDGGLKVWSKYEVMAKLIPETTTFMVAAESRFTTYRNPTEVADGWARRQVARSTIGPQDLPAHAADYEGVNLLVLSDPGLTEINTMQRQAIADWVQTGGTLVVAPGPNSTDRWFADWQALLPVEFCLPDKTATDSRLRQWGVPPTFAEGLATWRMAMKTGNVLVGDANWPLLVATKKDLGTVAAFSLDSGDIAFQGWTGATNFNAELIAIALRSPPVANRILEHAPDTDSIVSGLAGIKVLGRGPMLVFLVVLAGGMIGVLYVFRQTRAPERGWVVAAGFAVIAGGSAIAVADRWKGLPEPFLNEINIVRVTRNAQHAATYSALGLYSPHDAKFDLTATAETAQVRPRTGMGITPEPFALLTDDLPRLPELAVRASDIRVMYGHATLPPGKWPQAQARLTPAGLELVVSNPTSQPLLDCFFKYNRLVAPIGDLPAGATKTFKDVTAGTPGADVRYTERVVQSAEDELRSRIRRILFPEPIYVLGRQRPRDWMTLRYPTSPSDWPPAVYGWSTAPLFPVQITGPALTRRAVNLWAVETPLACEGQRGTLPSGLLTMRLRNMAARTAERAEGRFSGTRPGEIIAEFALPAECPNLRVDEAKVIVAYRGTAHRCVVTMLPPGLRDFDDVKRSPQTALTGGPVYNVTDPGKWYDPVRRSFTVAVSIEALDAAAMTYWQVREFDMEIGGTVQ